MRVTSAIPKKIGHLWSRKAHLGTRSAMKTPSMKRLLAKVEATLTAAVFAEEGDAETARRILAQGRTDEPGDR